MIRIRPEQLDRFEATVPDNLRHEFARRLRLLYPERTKAMGEAKLRQTVDDGFADAKDLEIPVGEDVFRLIHLQFLPEFDLNHPFNQSAVFRILNNTAMPGGERLDLIYQRVVPQTPPKDQVEVSPQLPIVS